MVFVGNVIALVAAFIAAQVVGAVTFLVSLPATALGSMIATAGASGAGLSVQSQQALIAALISSLRFGVYVLAGIASIYVGEVVVGWFGIELWIVVPLLLSAVVVLQCRSWFKNPKNNMPLSDLVICAIGETLGIWLSYFAFRNFVPWHGNWLSVVALPLLVLVPIIPIVCWRTVVTRHNAAANALLGKATYDKLSWDAQNKVIQRANKILEQSGVRGADVMRYGSPSDSPLQPGLCARYGWLAIAMYELGITPVFRWGSQNGWFVVRNPFTDVEDNDPIVKKTARHLSTKIGYPIELRN